MTQRHHSLRYLFFLLALAGTGLWIGLWSRAEVKNAPAPWAEAVQQPLAAQPQAAQPHGTQAVQTPNPYLMDGGAGPCSIDLHVIDTAGKPVSTAFIRVHIAYGFGGFHKLDMSVYSGPEGKARFTGIPEKPKNAPLQFYATKGELYGVASMNPASECQAKHDVVMDVPKSQK